MIRVDHTGGVRVAPHKGAGGVALAADVVAVLAHELVEEDDLAVGARVDPIVRQIVQGNERRLRRVFRAHRDGPALEVAHLVGSRCRSGPG